MRDNLDGFKNYKLDVNVVYYDECGRSLTPKEAWKALSPKSWAGFGETENGEEAKVEDCGGEAGDG